MKSLRQVGRQRTLLFLVAILFALIAWEFIVRMTGYEAFILPPPALVFRRLATAILDGSLLRHTLVTLGEVAAGLACGVGSAAALGYALARRPAIERLLSPYIIASQSVPTVAIAPLLIIWFGPGPISKILICTLIVFFPVLVNTVIGLRSVPDDLRDLMRSLQANSWQTFRILEAPAALPVFLGGLRIGATLAVIGAVVGEFVGADRGLGFLINRARGVYDTALVFVAILALVVMALGLYAAVLGLENRLLAWREKPE